MSRAQADFDVRRAHRYFSATCFNRTWELMDAPHRTPEQQQEMLDASHASLWHWRQRDDLGPANLAIAYWQLSRVHALLASAGESERYARLSLASATEPGIPPFHQAYAFEALARAASIARDAAKVRQSRATSPSGSKTPKSERCCSTTWRPSRARAASQRRSARRGMTSRGRCLSR